MRNADWRRRGVTRWCVLCAVAAALFVLARRARGRCGIRSARWGRRRRRCSSPGRRSTRSWPRSIRTRRRFRATRPTTPRSPFPARSASRTLQGQHRRAAARARCGCRRRTALTGPEVDLGSNDELFWFWVRRNEPPAVYFARHRPGRGQRGAAAHADRAAVAARRAGLGRVPPDRPARGAAAGATRTRSRSRRSCSRGAGR